MSITIHSEIQTVIHRCLEMGKKNQPQKDTVKVFAPANIALCKYWGKRDQHLNLPNTSSLSVSLGPYGSTTQMSFLEGQYDHDVIILNGQKINNTAFTKRLSCFLDHFRHSMQHSGYYHITIDSNLPIAAGFASSAAGFASIVLALNALYDWQLPRMGLSILARLGSGSACRSLSYGFVEWTQGIDRWGMDSYGKEFGSAFPYLRMGLLVFNSNEKYLSSRAAMQQTQDSSHFYSNWIKQVNEDLPILKTAIQTQNFKSLGEVTEANALALHAVMLSARPPVIYTTSKTLATWQKIWQLRQEGLQVYFTQDAGPNLKLLFLEKDRQDLQKIFSEDTFIVLDPMERGEHFV